MKLSTAANASEVDGVTGATMSSRAGLLYTSDSNERFYYIALRRIILPDGLEKIGKSAFFQAYALRQVNFPSSLRYLGCLLYTSGVFQPQRSISLAHHP